MSEGPTVVGSIAAYLDLDIDRFLAKAEEARALGDAIERKPIKQKIETDTTQVSNSFRQMGRDASDAFKKASDGAKGAGNDIRGSLIGALVAVSSAAPPVAAAAVGITGALGLMGAAGVLAFGGIARGLKDNTLVGQQYRGIVNSLQSDLHRLQDTAAMGLLPGAQQSVAVLQSNMPALNAEVSHFAGMLGDIAPVGLDAVVTMLERAEPLFNQAGLYVEHLVSGLDNWAHGNGFQNFIDYAIRNLPMVESLLGTVGGLVIDFIKAWAPLGQVTLPIVVALASTLDALIKGTGPLVPLAITVFGAFKTWGAIAPIIAGISAAIDVVTASLAGMDIAEAIASDGLSLLVGAAAAAGTVALLSQNGIKVPGVTGGTSPGNGSIPGGGYTTAGGGASSGQPSSGLGGGDTSYNAFGAGPAASSNKAAASAATGASAAYKAEAQSVATATNALNAQATAANAAATANTRAATAALKVENADDSAKDAIAGLTGAINQNGTSLDQNTSKGRANREAFAGAVGSIQSAGKAYQDSGHSANDARIKMDGMAASLVNQAVKSGISRKAAEALVDKLMGFPKGVTTTIDLKRAQAEAALTAQKKALVDFANGDYTAALKADPKDMTSKVAAAQKRADAMAQANYTAALKADPHNATANTAEAGKKAHAFATGAYTAAIRADASQAISAARAAQNAINGVRSKTVYLTVYESLAGQVNAAQVAMNAARYGATGGTAGSSSFGSQNAIRGLAGGGGSFGTISGAGHASSDTAGLYRLANGEEVISNLFGQADKWRPLLKAINAGRLDYRTFEQIASRMGAKQVASRHTTIAPEIHVHNPVAVDPVTQAAEAVQYALAYAGLG